MQAGNLKKNIFIKKLSEKSVLVKNSKWKIIVLFEMGLYK
jgi:hypothetical protein